jgi:putative ABC transport system substrate-binding protein
MHVGTDHIPPSWPSLRARLEELGWSQGRNVELIWRNLEPDAAAAQAERLVRRRVDVIVAFEDTSIRAAEEATAGMSAPIPIVFLHPSDPVRDGLVATLSHPDRNLTGVYGARDVVAKQLELYQLLAPRLRRMPTLVDPEDPST